MFNQSFEIGREPLSSKEVAGLKISQEKVAMQHITLQSKTLHNLVNEHLCNTILHPGVCDYLLRVQFVLMIRSQMLQ